MKKQFIIMMVSILVLVGSGQVMAVTQYTITDLGTFYPIGINNSGWVVGNSTLYGPHAFLYNGSTMTDLGSAFTATAINDSGWVAGYIGDHAFLYNGTTMKDLGTLGGSSSQARGINDSGWVVGWSNPAGSSVQMCAFLYNGTTMKNLGTLVSGGGFSDAYGINNSGQVVGYSGHAFLYDGGRIHDLGTLGGDHSDAEAINDSGWVVGWSYLTGSSTQHAFLYNGTTMKDLGTLGGDSFANGINNSGQIVGWFNNHNGSHAFLYDGGNMIDLITLLPAGSGWELWSPYGINDSGQIVGFGYLNGNPSGFLMTPVPEPATLLLLGLSAVMLTKRRRYYN